MRNRGKRMILIALAGIVIAVIASCILGTVKIKGTSMEPAISEGSIVLVNKTAYFYRAPEKGDVVVFHCNVYSEDEEGSILVRRVAAAEGDRIRVTDGNIYVNDELYTGYSEDNIYMDPMDEVTVGRNRVFVVSDSGKAVLDSRDQAVGQLCIDELDGKVCFR